MEHALCYGWIDSRAVKRDGESRYLRFSPRSPRSTWSRLNRERAEKMTAQGLMTPHGQAVIEVAKASGTWDALADAQNSVVPDDLQQLFDQDQKAFAHFQAFPPSSKRTILEWIANAKRPDTRVRRLVQTVELARENIRANHARQRRQRRPHSCPGRTSDGCRAEPVFRGNVPGRPRARRAVAPALPI